MVAHSSRKSRFRQIVQALRGYTVDYLQREAKPLRRLASSTALPAPLAWSSLRGEGIVRLRFCAYFENLGLEFAEAEDMLALWARFGCHHGLVFDLLARAGVFSALATQFRVPEPTPELAWQIYCGIIDAVERSGNEELLALLTDRFWLHHWQSQFPEEAPKTSGTPALSTRRQQLLHGLRTKFRIPVELREQFQANDDHATFRLRYRLCPPTGPKGEWQLFPEFAGPRLKPIKLAAYLAALETLTS